MNHRGYGLFYLAFNGYLSFRNQLLSIKGLLVLKTARQITNHCHTSSKDFKPYHFDINYKLSTYDWYFYK
jgi:hypothetical protein